MDQDGHHHHHFDLSPIIIVLFGIMAGSVVVAAYQCIVAHSCRTAAISSPDRNGARSEVPSRQQTLAHEPTSHVVGNTSLATAQPASTYLKLRIREFKDGKCAVCLSEFNSGEEIRVLPECGHGFHMVCVDMWLFSHSNCPLCRARTDKAQHVIVVPMQSSSSSGNSSPSEIRTQITGSQET